MEASLQEGHLSLRKWLEMTLQRKAGGQIMPGLVNHGRSSRFTIKALRSHQQHFKLSLCCEEKELGTVRSESWKVGLRQDFSASVQWTFQAWWVLVARGCPMHYRHATAFLVSTHHIPQSKMSPDPAVCPLRWGVCVCVCKISLCQEPLV